MAGRAGQGRAGQGMAGQGRVTRSWEIMEEGGSEGDGWIEGGREGGTQ